MIQFTKEKQEQLRPVQPGYRKIKFLMPIVAKKTSTGKDIIEVSYSGLNSSINRESFFLTEKAIVKLKSFHEGLFKTPIERNFENNEELANYFTEMFFQKYNEESIFNTRIDGEIVNNTVYSKLPFYTEFKDTMKERDFTDQELKMYVREKTN